MDCSRAAPDFLSTCLVSRASRTVVFPAIGLERDKLNLAAGSPVLMIKAALLFPRTQNPPSSAGKAFLSWAMSSYPWSFRINPFSGPMLRAALPMRKTERRAQPQRWARREGSGDSGSFDFLERRKRAAIPKTAGIQMRRGIQSAFSWSGVDKEGTIVLQSMKMLRPSASNGLPIPRARLASGLPRLSRKRRPGFRMKTAAMKKPMATSILRPTRDARFRLKANAPAMNNAKTH